MLADLFGFAGADGGSLSQPHFHAFLLLLPARTLSALRAADSSCRAALMHIVYWTLAERHPSLDGCPWPKLAWWRVADLLEQALLVEDFSEGWRERWTTQRPQDVLPDDVVRHPCGGARFRCLAIGAPKGLTLFPGMGLRRQFPCRLQPKELHWLVRASGVSRGGDGRIGCVSFGSGNLEAIRTYFNRGTLWWEASALDPCPLLDMGSYRDGAWCHVRVRLHWHQRCCDVALGLFPPDAAGDPPAYVPSKRLSFHSAGCDAISWLAVGSVVFGQSLLSGADADIAQIVLL